MMNVKHLVPILTLALAACTDKALETAGVVDAGALNVNVLANGAPIQQSWEWGAAGLSLGIDVVAPPQEGTLTVSVTGPAALLSANSAATQEGSFPFNGRLSSLEIPLEIANQYGEVKITVKADGPVSSADLGLRERHRTFTVQPAVVSLQSCLQNADGDCIQSAPTQPATPKPCSELESGAIECEVAAQPKEWAGSRAGLVITVPPLPATHTGSHRLEIEASGALALRAGQGPASLALPPASQERKVIRLLEATGDGVGIVRARIAEGPFSHAEVPVTRGSVTLRRITFTGYRNLEVEADLTFCTFHSQSAAITLTADSGTVLAAGAGNAELVALPGDCPEPSIATLRGRWRGAPGRVLWTTVESGRRTSQHTDLTTWTVRAIELAEISRQDVPGASIVALELRGLGVGTGPVAMKNTDIEIRPLVAGVTVQLPGAPQREPSEVTRTQTDDKGRLMLKIATSDAGATSSDAGVEIRVAVFATRDVALSATY